MQKFHRAWHGDLRVIVLGALANVLALVIWNSPHFVALLVAPIAPHTPVSHLAPSPPTNLEANQSTGSSVPQCCTTTFGPNTPTAPVLRPAAMDGIPSSSLQETLSHSDNVTVVVTQVPPVSLVNAVDPNALLGIPQYSFQDYAARAKDIADTLAAIGKNDSDSGILTLTGSRVPTDWTSGLTADAQLTGVQPISVNAFDPSKISESLSPNQAKLLTGAIGLTSEEIAQAAQWSHDHASALGIPSGADAMQWPSNSTIGNTGVPTVLPTTWQTSPVATGAFPTIIPTTLPTTLQ